MSDTINTAINSVTAPNDRARALIDAQLGIGKAAAYEELRTNAVAKRIYDCAVLALANAVAARP